MNRFVRLLAVMALLVAACGGGDDAGVTSTAEADGASSSTTTSAPATTSAVVANPSDDFCGFMADYAENVDFSPTAMNPAQLEDLFKENLDAIDRAIRIAPGDIKGDVEMFAEAYEGFIGLLEEYDFNFIAMGDAIDDPRLLAMEDPALEEAGERIETYCGIENFIDATPDTGGGTTGGTSGVFPGTELPDDFPADLVPPGGELVAAIDLGATGQSIMFELESATEETVDFYTEKLGEPTLQIAEPPSSLWSTEYEGATVNVIVSEGRPGVTQVNVVIE